MVVGTPISTCSTRSIVNVGRSSHRMGYTILNTLVKGKSTSCCLSLPHSCSMDNYSRLSVSNVYSRCPTFNRIQSWFPRNNKGMLQSITVKGSLGARIPLRRFNISFPCQNMSMRVSVSDRGINSKIKGSFGHVSWFRDCAATSLIFGLLVCYSSSDQAHAETDMWKKDTKDDCASPHSKVSHGKKIYTDYSVIGIPGDGRCLFRSVVHGACMRAGKQAPREGLQRELADELRSNVADEFIKRRQETEWFVEGDFDSYVAQMRKPHVWGGEPELLMASHVLRMPITVYMYDKDAGGLISIAEYGQEYGKDNPIRLLYHGFGHYDSLQIPGTGRQGGAVSKL